jgi:hypothetical protein
MKKNKKYIVHVLALAAMSLGWLAIGNLHDRLHAPVKLANKISKKRSNGKRSKFSKQLELAQTEPVQAKPAPIEQVQIKPAQAKPVQTEPVQAKPVQAKTTQSERAKVGLAQTKATQQPTQSGGLTIDKTKIDTNFIRQVEGSVSKGYVPLPKTSSSGVTVGEGVDLGQLNKNQLEKLQINQSLKQKLVAYIGLKKQKAVVFLKTHPLSINSSELEQLDAISANKILKPLATAYQAATGKSFSSLPSQAQTALFSVAYQHGPGFMKKHGRLQQLWGNFTSGHWAEASNLLKSLKKYGGRHHQEAHLLDQIKK